MTYARNQALGSYGERIAADHLVASGLVILDRNWRCRFGEIDIVARDGTTLVICEVKTRSNLTFGPPTEAVTTHKANRLRRLAQAWLETHDVHPPAVRIDLVSVLVPRSGAAEVDLIRGVA
ncbi:YraN family protein [Aeromicrobium sp. Leaf350]|uniref:YraN family protein n=1 Tax=Aeromicrobium sp. Leaf350 TaxID=2876565 RepID=UPI001E5AEC62|nr:YraN family protein [Aeromicrobium sp. Leaf350]